jgi:hypothetical protein
MKKFLLYILISITLVGLFSSAWTIQAQEIKKNCYSIPLAEGGFSYRDNTTEEQCATLGGAWRDTASGNPLPPAPTPTAPAPEINTDTTYTPLASLPGLGDKLCKDSKGVEKPCFDTATPCAFSKYMNIMINLLIGFAAVLAVIMIVLGGLEYMTSELPSAKGNGKERISNALLGLVIALGAWALLNTLNPLLLNVCLDKLPEAKITIDEAPPTAGDFNPNEIIPTGGVRTCSEGITKVETSGGTFTLCRRISSNVQSMINKAWSEGYRISGWGYRSHETQIALRTKNHCPDVNTSPASDCRPPTAIPGTSMHESGLAVDLTCDGQTAIQTHDNRCFIWLTTNAASFGLQNLGSEPWHWSVDGR